MGSAGKRLASAVFQRDVALLLGCAAISAAGALLTSPVPPTEVPIVLIQAVLEFVPLVLLVRFARRRTDGGHPLSLGPLAIGIGIATTLGALVTTYPGPYSFGGVALDVYGGLVRAALFVAALELYARAVRAQALAHEMRQTTARLDAELQEARALPQAQIGLLPVPAPSPASGSCSGPNPGQPSTCSTI
jgi:hypothetical protein